MKTVIIIDDPLPLPVLIPYLHNQQQSMLVVNDLKTAQLLPQETKAELAIKQNLADKNLSQELCLYSDDRVILCIRNQTLLGQCIATLRNFSKEISIAVIGKTRAELQAVESVQDVFPVSLEELVTQQLATIWQKIENLRRIKSLRDISQTTDAILILVQNDPDPDAIASGLALRVLLGRNRQTAPIGSFGTVTRSENLNMIELLDIPVVKLTATMLGQFSKIAMVDVQPPYFREHAVTADIVIDHHPVSDAYAAPYADIRVPYGATATILGEYLIDGGYKITQRLATALTYGIKTDTMFLERDISPADIQVFTVMYPMANLNMIRQFESAALTFDEIKRFMRALKHVRIMEKTIFAYLGRVPREDMVPRLADFCLQIGRAEWSFVTGIFSKHIVCCVRNVGYVKHAGELVRRTFGDIGSAGGHRSMAKAVIPIKKFKEKYSLSRMPEIENKIIEIITSARA